MSTIIVSGSSTPTPLPASIAFAAIAIAVTDNSGAALPPQTVTPDASGNFTATFTGTLGPNEVTATATALDAQGNTLGTVATGTESGTGGQPGTFPQPTGLTISVQ